MEDLAVFTALNHSGSFGKNFVKFKKYIYTNILFAGWEVRMVKNCDLGLENAALGLLPPSRQITYIYSMMRFKENPLPDSSLRDSCDIGFRLQFNAEFPRQVMNFPTLFNTCQ